MNVWWKAEVYRTFRFQFMFIRFFLNESCEWTVWCWAPLVHPLHAWTPPAALLCSLTAADFRVTPLPDYFTSAGRIKINRTEKKFFFQEAAQWARTMWGLWALPSGLLPLALTHIHFTLSSWRADQEALMRFNTEGSGTLFLDVHKFHT